MPFPETHTKMSRANILRRVRSAPARVLQQEGDGASGWGSSTSHPYDTLTKQAGSNLQHTTPAGGQTHKLDKLLLHDNMILLYCFVSASSTCGVR